jgi:hypothetical protein
VFNTTYEQTKILNDIISNKSHWDVKDCKYCGREPVSWGGMKRFLNEGPLSTTNNTSKKCLTEDVVNFYLKNCLSMHGLLKCGRNLTRQFLFLQHLFVSNIASREKRKHKLSWDI